MLLKYLIVRRWRNWGGRQKRQGNNLHCKFEMVKFDERKVDKIFIFQLVNLDYFLVKNEYSLVTFNYSISYLQLVIGNSPICLKFSI